MKQLRILLLTTLITLICTAAVSAADFADGQALYQYWLSSQTEETISPYPDYVCGVWTEDDGQTFTIALTRDKAGERGQWKILDMVEDTDSIQFHSQVYSYQTLLDIQQALLPKLGESGFSSIRIRQQDNQAVLTIDTTQPDSESFMKTCFETYGDCIRFEDGSITLTAEDLGIGVKQNRRLQIEVEESPLTYTLVVILLILMLVTGRIMQGPSVKKHIMQDNPDDTHTSADRPEKQKRR